MTVGTVIPTLVAVCAIVVIGVLVLVRRQRRDRTRADDTLKLLATAQLEKRNVTVEVVAASLPSGVATAERVVERLAGDGLIDVRDGGLALTQSGHARAFHLLRAHRLMERYLVDEAGMSILQIHRQADRAEHALTPEQVAELSAHLGHPTLDPHGDPIPDRLGKVRPTDRVTLKAWAEEGDAVVVHVEDEPPAALRRIVALGILPGTVLRVVRREEAALTLRIGDTDRTLPADLAGYVHVRPAEAVVVAAPPPPTLASVPVGRSCEVVALAEGCRGLTRRRLLDLGITPGTTVRAERANAGRSAVAYRVRESLIALRKEQADMILVRMDEERAA